MMILRIMKSGGYDMLLQFSVTNHRSIKNTAVISMKAAADKKHERVPHYTGWKKRK